MKTMRFQAQAALRLLITLSFLGLLPIGHCDPPQSRLPLSGAELAALPVQVADQGPHHRSVFIADKDGNVVSKYVELLTGGWRQLQDGTWADCDTEIELFNGGAVARKTRYQVIFSPTSDDPQGVFDVLTPDKNRIRGQCIGLAYTSRDKSQSVFVAEMKDVPGFVFGKNEVVYPDCFDGIKADLRYRVELGSFHQDIILRSKLPPPSDFGLPNDSVLEVWTQILDAPEAKKSAFKVPGKDGVADDYLIGLGDMHFGLGHSFPLDRPPDNTQVELSRRVPVRKEYEQINGMQFLIETLPYSEVAAESVGLPRLEQASVKRKSLDNAVLARSGHPMRMKPVSLKTGQKPQFSRRSSTAFAMNKRYRTIKSDPGYVLDFELQLDAGNLTGYVFKADTTYYITGDVRLYGTCVLEGTVIKFANTNSAQIVVDGSANLIVKTDQYRPAYFLSRDDCTLGATISGSTCSPSGTYANIALAYDARSTGVNVSNIRVRDANWGIYFYDSATNTLSNSQFSRCNNAIVGNGATVNLRNLLVCNCLTNIYCANGGYSGENVTLDSLNQFISDNSTVRFTNSLFINITNFPSSIVGGFNATNSSGVGVFAQVAGGSHYLSKGSPYRNAGTTAINPTLASDLRTRTTSPPVVQDYTMYNPLANDLRLFPQALRDTDIPDLGYHYDPLDYIFDLVNVTNASVTIKPGTVVGMYSWGLKLKGNSKLSAVGTASSPIRFCREVLVQEGSYVINPPVGAFFELSSPASVSLNFVESILDNSRGTHMFGSTIAPMNSVFRGGESFSASGPFTNCLFEGTLFYSGPPLTLQNCSFYEGDINYPGSFPWLSSGANLIKDTLFDQTYIWNPSSNITHDHNAYLTNWPRLIVGSGNGSNDVVLTSQMQYTNGTFGPYYQTITNLVNRGSTSATNVGLYHFTATIPEVKEFGTTVDIGYHYPAAGEPSTNGLVGYWKFDEGTGSLAADSSGLGNHGTLVNGPGWASGQIGNSALSFDGIDDYVQVGPQSALVVSSTMTICAWVFPITGQGIIVNKEGEYEIALNSGKLQWAVANSSPGWTWIDTGWSPPTNQWSYIVVTYDNGAIRSYGNGTLVHTYNGSGIIGDVDTTNNDFRIGARQGTPQFFGGSIDDVRIYNRALTSAEIATLASRTTWDADGDGVPDYFEDVNGNGSLDSGETDPFSLSDAGFSVLISQPDKRSSLP